MKKILFILLLVSLFFGGYKYVSSDTDSIEYYPVVVEGGDTLDTISYRIVGDSMDRRKVVYDTIQKNGLDGNGTIHPGQRIVVVVKK